MLHIKIIAVGKLKEPYFLAAQAEYLKRLKPYLKLEIREVPDLQCPDNLSPAQKAQILKQEAKAILRQVAAKDHLIAFDRNGQQLSSIRFAALLKEKETAGVPLVFIIGGSLGLADDLLKKTSLELSFSELTFPHQLFRVILLEQIYRAVKINRGESYHK